MINWLRSSSAAFLQRFFTHDPLLELYVQSLRNVGQTLTLTHSQWATNICNDSNGLLAVCDSLVPMSKLMHRRDLDRY